MSDAKATNPTETKKVTEPVVLDISDSNVQTKYKDAGKIADGKFIHSRASTFDFFFFLTQCHL